MGVEGNLLGLLDIFYNYDWDYYWFFADFAWEDLWKIKYKGTVWIPLNNLIDLWKQEVNEPFSVNGLLHVIKASR